MIDPLLLAALRRSAHELSMSPDSDLATLGALNAMLCDALAQTHGESVVMWERALTIVRLNIATMEAVQESVGGLTMRLRALYDHVGLEWPARPRDTPPIPKSGRTSIRHEVGETHER